MRRGIYKEYRYKRLFLIVFSVVLFLVFYLFQENSTLVRVISTIACLFLFYFGDHLFDVRFRKRHYFFMFIIAVSGFLLSPLYFIYPNYDKIQHFILPMLMCSIGFFMISKLHLELKWKLVFTFFTVVALLGVFEIAEYLLDYFFNLQLQGVFIRDVTGLEKLNFVMDPLSDTIVDLAYGIAGSAIYCIAGAFYLRRKLNKHIFRQN